MFSTTLLLRLVEDVGVEHVLLATDHPFEVRDMDRWKPWPAWGCPGLRS